MRALADPNQHPRHRIADLVSVGQHERPLLFGCHAEPRQDVPRDPRVRGTRFDEGLDGLEALASPVADLEGDSEVAHARI